jgi:hypothetical protein
MNQFSAIFPVRASLFLCCSVLAAAGGRVCGRGRAAPPLLPPRALPPTQEEAEEEAQLWHQEVLALGKFALLKGVSHEIWTFLTCN